MIEIKILYLNNKLQVDKFKFIYPSNIFKFFNHYKSSHTWTETSKKKTIDHENFTAQIKTQNIRPI